MILHRRNTVSSQHTLSYPFPSQHYLSYLILTALSELCMRIIRNTL